MFIGLLFIGLVKLGLGCSKVLIYTFMGDFAGMVEVCRVWEFSVNPDSWKNTGLNKKSFMTLTSWLCLKVAYSYPDESESRSLKRGLFVFRIWGCSFLWAVPTLWHMSYPLSGLFVIGSRAPSVLDSCIWLIVFPKNLKALKFVSFLILVSSSRLRKMSIALQMFLHLKSGVFWVGI